MTFDRSLIPIVARMPAIFESFSRAPGFNVDWAVSKSTSDMLTTRPRAVSTRFKDEFSWFLKFCRSRSAWTAAHGLDFS